MKTGKANLISALSYLLLSALILSPTCNPKNHADASSLYQMMLQMQAFEAKCGPNHTLILLNTTLQGTVTHQGWNYYKFQAPTENDAVFTLTPVDATYDVDLAVGFQNQDVGTSIPSHTACSGWEKCSDGPAGVPEIIQPLHLLLNHYRCIGVYGRNCAAGSCNFTLNASWYVKP
jgi:hypothetical protein